MKTNYYPIFAKTAKLISFLFLIIYICSGCRNDRELQTVLDRLAVSWNTNTGDSGKVNFMSTPSPWSFNGVPIPIDMHSFLHYYGSKLYVVSRSEGTVRAININNGDNELIASLGIHSEPQDIAVIDDVTAYLTLRRATNLVKLDLQSGETTEVVDLSEYADDDGVPDLGNMIVHDDRLFVQIRRSSDFLPVFVPPAYIAVVDLETEQIVDTDPELPGVQAIELEGTSPKSGMQILPEVQRLYVSATGGSFDDGGIEAIDLNELVSLGLILKESDGNLGADVGAFIMINTERGYVVVTTDIEESSHLTPFTVLGGAGEGEMYSSNGHFAPALEYDTATGFLFFPDGVPGISGIHVFDVNTNERLTTTPIATDGPPTDIILLPGNTEHEFSFTFEEGTDNWTGDFSDYTVDEEELFELEFEHTALPEPLDTSRNALKISGKNLSDDLFMFIKRRITGLSPETVYCINFDMELATDAPDSGVGAGGDPAIPLKVGAATIEPWKVEVDNYYQMNIDKGNQEPGGEDMITIGDTGNGTDEFIYKSVNKNNEGQLFQIESDENGEIWVIIGTDSDFESTTTLYYDSILIKLNSYASCTD